MIAQHLPVLIVLLPLIAGLVSPFVRRGVVSSWLSPAVTWSAFLMAVGIASRVAREGVVSYALGGWAAPMGIEYRLDGLNALFLVVVTGIAAVSSLQARVTIPRDAGPARAGKVQSVYLLCLTGLLGIVVTGDAFNAYVLLEVSSLATYALVACGRSPKARPAAFNYLILGSLGATFILVGIGHLYMLTGSLDMVDISHRLRALPPSNTLAAAIAFLVVGLALKSALFPFHAWLPDAYTQAPASVAAFLSGTATKVGLYMMVRFLHDVVGLELAFRLLPLRTVLLTLAVVGGLYGSIMATRQDDVRRMLAYSSVAQVGYIVLGLALGNLAGVTGGLLHVINHSMIKAGMFLAVGALIHEVGTTKLSELRGIGRRMPFTAAALAVGGAGLVGLPLTAGFVSKWYLVVGALDAGLWPLALVMGLGAAIAIVYVGRMVATLYSASPAEWQETVGVAGPSLSGPAWILIASSIAFGVAAGPTVALASRAAEGVS